MKEFVCSSTVCQISNMPKHFDKSEPAERFENLVGQSVLQDISMEIVLLLIGPKSGWAQTFISLLHLDS